MPETREKKRDRDGRQEEGKSESKDSSGGGVQ